MRPTFGWCSVGELTACIFINDIPFELPALYTLSAHSEALSYLIAIIGDSKFIHADAEVYFGKEN